MSKSARTIFCRFCGASGAHRHGYDARRRARFKCPHCGRTFGKRTNTIRSGSRFSDDDWRAAIKLFCLRGGICGQDIARFFDVNEKTGQRFNRIFRTMAMQLHPKTLSGVSEWDEAMPIRGQWVLGGVSRERNHCLMQCITDRTEHTLSTLVEQYKGSEGLAFTDEWHGYDGVYRRMTVCHSREFVNSQARFVHTNTQEGIWGHLKPLGWHLYRGFPRNTLSSYLSEFMFRRNIRCYQTRIAVLSALISRKSHTQLV